MPYGHLIKQNNQSILIVWIITDSGDNMNLETIGKNIRKYRKAKKLSQESLAEMTELSTNYIGLVERGKKVPALDTFLRIANALEVSADMLLEDVIYNGYKVKDSLISERLELLSPVERAKVYDIIEVMIKHSK